MLEPLQVQSTKPRSLEGSTHSLDLDKQPSRNRLCTQTKQICTTLAA